MALTLTRLREHGNYTPSLFQTVADTMASFDADKHRRLDTAIDQLRARYGRGIVYFGGVQDHRDQAPMRISFTHISDLELERD